MSRFGKLHRDLEPAGRSGSEGVGAVVRADDALDDRQTEADPGVVGAGALTPALERLDEHGDPFRREHRAGVLHGELDAPGVDIGGDPHGRGADPFVGAIDQIELSHGFFRIHQEDEPEQGSENAVVTVPADLSAATNDRLVALARER